MNVLSLFDGMSCGQIALNRIGIKPTKYFSSEIDKHAIKVTMANYPDTIQLGSVVDVDGSKLGKIDLLIGGSPCQSFSFAGKRKGMSTKDNVEILTLEHYLELKNNGFEFEGQSYLFWEYIRLLKEVNPSYFLLENVEMGENWERVLSTAIGINGIHINSALVSAQNRKRIYWTNIGMKPSGLFGYPESIIEQPKDKGVLLRDILESEVDEKYYIKNEKMIKFITDVWRLDKKYTQINGEKSITQTARQYSSWCGDYIKIPEATKKGYAEIKLGECFDFENPNSKTRRGRKMEDKSNCLMAKETQFMHYTKDAKIRRLTPIECERLQTVPDNYTSYVSDTQRYKMLGNGWTVDVIAHIFSYINK